MNVPATPSQFMIDSARQWIADKLAAARIQYFPIPHLIIENFFPPALYGQLLELNPFQLVAGTDWATHTSRKEIHLPDDASGLSQTAAAALWAEVSRIFLEDRWLFEKIKAKFPDYFQLRYGPLCADDDFDSMFDERLFAQRHDRGFFIDPHTDMPMRVATCIFSLADNADFAEYGTELCVPVDRLFRCSGRQHHPRDLFRVVKVAPYQPNNFLLFFRTSHSFHAVRPIDRDIANSRYGMQYQVWERNGGLFHGTATLQEAR